jgi:hypothetical protein
MKAFRVVIAAVVVGLCVTIGCASPRDPVPVRVIVNEAIVGTITLGSGWNTWDHWGPPYVPRFRLTWNDAQWAAYFGLLKESGADWLRLDFYYGDTEPRNDNNDPEFINWAAFTFDSPGLRSLYRFLDFSQVNAIDVYLVHTYLRSNHAYNMDRMTGWLSTEAVAKGFPELWTRPKDEPVDVRELAENLAATTYHLLKRRNYTCIKQVALYVEPVSQWTNVDGYRDTIFLGKLLTKLGIRDRVAILAPHEGIGNLRRHYWPPRAGDYDIFAVEDYKAKVDWATPGEGLKNLYDYKRLMKELKRRDPPITEVGVMEYAKPFNTLGATSPMPAYLGTLASSALVFELYNSGLAGVQRWAFEPIYHPYLGYAVMTVEGVKYGPAATEVVPETTTPIIDAMAQGARVVKLPYTFEPQRLVNTNLSRGSKVYRVEVVDSIPPGKGVGAIAVKDKERKWRVGLINLYSSARKVEVVFPAEERPGRLRWDYYDATLPESLLRGVPPSLVGNTLSLTLPARSLSFLSDVGG